MQRTAEQLAEGFMGSAEFWYRGHGLSACQRGPEEIAAWGICVCEKTQRTVGLLDLGSIVDAREAWCGEQEKMFGACYPGAAGQELLRWALDRVEFFCGSRDVMRNEGHLHRWKRRCCKHPSSKPGCEIPMAREGHADTAERSPGVILEAWEARGGLSSTSPAISRSGSPSLVPPSWGLGAVSTVVPLAGLWAAARTDARSGVCILVPMFFTAWSSEATGHKGGR